MNVLFSQKQITDRVVELGTLLNKDYSEIVVISIVSGAIIFTADLIRQLTIPVQLDTLRVSSYKHSTSPVSLPEISSKLSVDIYNKDVLLIDDVLDTGNTILSVIKTIELLHPRSIKTCMLLEKRIPRTTIMHADYVGFYIDNQFVIGYGLDDKDYCRNLPYIACK